MKIIDAIFFYTLHCSAVLVYGIGILQEAENSLSRKKIGSTAIKSLACSLVTVSLTFSINKLLLAPLGLSELYPLAALLLWAAFSSFFEIIAQLATKKSAAEFAVSYLAALIALNESPSLLGAIVIDICCIAGCYALIPVLYSFTSKMVSVKNADTFRQKISVFFCMMILLLALYALNISWIYAGV
ncbi:MAG: hypothetical protein II610_07620 [Treponema sp.]|nr:hypothetical protein [Treponema sp.]MBR3544261.1 hypothetical protein [Treponema sp.]